MISCHGRHDKTLTGKCSRGTAHMTGAGDQQDVLNTATFSSARVYCAFSRVVRLSGSCINGAAGRPRLPHFCAIITDSGRPPDSVVPPDSTTHGAF